MRSAASAAPQRLRRSRHAWAPGHSSGSCRVRRAAESQAMQRRRCGAEVHKGGRLESLVEIGSARAPPPSAQSNAPPGGPDRGARAAGLWRCLEGRSRQCRADVVAGKVAGEVRLMRDRAGKVGAHDAVVHAARRLVVHRRVFEVERLLDACMGRELPHMDGYTTQRRHLKAAQLGCSRLAAQARYAHGGLHA